MISADRDRTAVPVSFLVVGLGSLLDAVAHRHQKNGALAFGVRGEKAGYVVIVKGEAGGAHALGIGREVEFAAEDAGFKLHGSISAISQTAEYRPQVRQKENIDGGVGRQLLLQSEIARLLTKISLF